MICKNETIINYFIDYIVYKHMINDRAIISDMHWFQSYIIYFLVTSNNSNISFKKMSISLL